MDRFVRINSIRLHRAADRSKTGNAFICSLLAAQRLKDSLRKKYVQWNARCLFRDFVPRFDLSRSRSHRDVTNGKIDHVSRDRSQVSDKLPITSAVIASRMINTQGTKECIEKGFVVVCLSTVRCSTAHRLSFTILHRIIVRK